MKKIWLYTALVLFACETTGDPSLIVQENPFLEFTLPGQTLPSSINEQEQKLTFEVSHKTDRTHLVPTFKIPAGHSIYVNGILQESGKSMVDFSQPVTYEVKGANNRVSQWTVSATPLNCKILIDASHDGGVWWFPQWEGTGFDPNTAHQGQLFASKLREKGFEVSELGRGKELTDEMFFGSYIIIRVGGFEPYTKKELGVYSRLLDRGMNLVFFTDHKKNDPTDELGDLLGLNFKGVASGEIVKFTDHPITADLTSIPYIAGSVLTNLNEQPAIEILGWLNSDAYADLNFNGVQDTSEPVGPPVMGVLNYSKSKIFFIGDSNGIEIQPQPFIDNLITWMGQCALY